MRTRLNKMIGAKESVEKNIAITERKLKDLKLEHKFHIQAQEIIKNSWS